MPKIRYVDRSFSEASLAVVRQANQIIDAYAAQGYILTLRQLYYQFVARDLLPNKQTEYKRLGSIVNDGRLAGLIDWEAIEDRTRNLEALPHWDGPDQIVHACASQFRYDRWEDQRYRVEVWIEKEALAGVFQRICNKLDVPYLSCRGYASQSEMWRAAQRLNAHYRNGQKTLILHFGDHDPSGVDMTRDIRDRLGIFGCKVEVNRIALNMDQVDQYQPPPNPAKVTDSRATGYIREFGHESWELDALEPAVLEDLVRTEVQKVIDQTAWDERAQEEKDARQWLGSIAENWDRVVSFMQEDDLDE